MSHPSQKFASLLTKRGFTKSKVWLVIFSVDTLNFKAKTFLVAKLQTVFT